MLTPSEQCPVRHECLREGKGLTHIKDLAGRPELYDHGRLFAHITLDPGCSIGSHPHEHETEFYYIIRGEGTFFDNGEEKTVRAGDLCATGYGETHGMENRTAEPLEFIALIMLE